MSADGPLYRLSLHLRIWSYFLAFQGRGPSQQQPRARRARFTTCQYRPPSHSANFRVWDYKANDGHDCLNNCLSKCVQGNASNSKWLHWNDACILQLNSLTVTYDPDSVDKVVGNKSKFVPCSHDLLGKFSGKKRLLPSIAFLFGFSEV